VSKHKLDAACRPDAAFHTEVGPVRKNNEDTALCLLDKGLFIVADGMGGAAAGEVASNIAAETLSMLADGLDTLRETLTETLMSENPGFFDKSAPDENNLREYIDTLKGGAPLTEESLIATVMMIAHGRILREAAKKPHLTGMGTAAAAAWIKGCTAYVGHVGDCRVYHERNGVLTRLTNDHSLVGTLVRAGKISEEESLRHPMRNLLTQVLGGETIPVPEVLSRALQPSDRLLMCSDGVWGGVTDEAIGAALAEKLPPLVTSMRLVRAAYKGGSKDNATALVITVGGRR
jgi:protein phosphatase